MLTECDGCSICLTDSHRVSTQVVVRKAGEIHSFKPIGRCNRIELRNIARGRIQFSKNELLLRKGNLGWARENIGIGEKYVFCIICSDSELGDIRVGGNHLIDCEMEAILEGLVGGSRSLGLHRKISTLS